jgi:hypothetical protein
MLRGRHGIVWMLIGWAALSGGILLAIAIGAWLAQF